MPSLLTLMILFIPVTPDAVVLQDDHRSVFTLCPRGPRVGDCVVDGDTFWMAGEKIRIADIDTPETFQPRCLDEAARGAEAKMKLLSLLNAGAFTLVAAERDTDRYNRKLRIVVRRGQSVGAEMVNLGLARWYDDGRRSWC